MEVQRECSKEINYSKEDRYKSEIMNFEMVNIVIAGELGQRLRRIRGKKRNKSKPSNEDDMEFESQQTSNHQWK